MALEPLTVAADASNPELIEQELWREALAFNAFWFEAHYVATGYYFKVVQNIDWESVDPASVMGKQYLSSSGWIRNVDSELRKRNFLPNRQDGASCGLQASRLHFPKGLLRAG
ncbi:MAG: hypothetical protein ACYC9Z_15955 [Casimicrobiaceae bacterium]